MDKKDLITLILPCYNEEDALPYLWEALNKISYQMPYVNFEFLFVNNCSSDNTLKMMKEYADKDSRVKYISFSRNFGKEGSMYVGLSNASGDYVAILDADLQDPPELLIPMYEAVTKEGYDCAAAFRTTRKGEPWLRSQLAKVFYKLENKISDTDVVNGARDFRLMSRKVVDAILMLGERERFSKGIFGWVGFETKWIPFENVQRVAGKSKLPMSFAFKYALKGIVAFSTLPLEMASGLGIFSCLLAIIYAIYVILKQVITHEAVAGYPSIICLILFMGGILLLMMGVMGRYIAQIYIEDKKRPIYIVKDTNVDDCK